MKSAYIHIPFCTSICSYCDFCKMFYNPKWAHDYLIALRDEMNDLYMGEELKTIYIGGGTPSCLSIKEMEFLLKCVSSFERSLDYEFTFECNLNDITEEKLLLLKNYGVNRLSIGIESFCEEKLKLMGRHHTFLEAKEKIGLIRKCGFSNINVDLIYGFFSETLADLKDDIKKFLDLGVEHISTYSLILSDHTLLKVNKIPTIDEDLDAEFYETICKLFSKKKYRHYEISNFAKAGYESKHNLNYWNNGEYYGFGLSASGYLEGMRYTNTFNLNKYLNHEFDGERVLLSPTDIMDNEIMLGLRKIEGISVEQFYKKYGISIYDAYPISVLVKQKELCEKNGYIFINPGMLYVSNEILIKLI